MVWGMPPRSETIVPAEARISDLDAELLLAGLLAETAQGRRQAAALYERLVMARPGVWAVRLAYARTLLRLDRPEEAGRHMAEARRLLAGSFQGETAGQLAGGLADLADLEAEVGHLDACRDLYQQALRVGGGQEELARRYANRLNLWGDFLAAAKLFRGWREKEPANVEPGLALAEALANSQRFAEAEGVARELLLTVPQRQDPLVLLARIKHGEGDDPSARAWLEKVLAQDPGHLVAALLLGEVLLRQGEAEAAMIHFRGVAARYPDEARVFLGLGRACLAAGQGAAGREALATALAMEPASVEASYHASWEERTTPVFLARLLAELAPQPMRLVRWGNLYAEHGERQAAIACQRAALARDPACFPARMGLAEALASDGLYGEALNELDILEKGFPDTPKLLLTRARILSWAKEYGQAEVVYARLLSLDPSNPLPRIERARMAAWDRRLEEAKGMYAELWGQPVDEALRTALAGLAGGATMPLLPAAAPPEAGQEIFGRYEAFSQALEQGKESLPPEQWHHMALQRERLFGRYRIQKSALLESRGKELVWRQRPLAARETYGQLLAFQTGNQEARFDASQVACSLGLCDEEGEEYQRLLAISPLHDMAASGLARQRTRSNPAIGLSASAWKETGRGELADLSRHREELVAELPLACRFRLQAGLGQEEERPGPLSETYRSERLAIKLSGPITPWLRGSVGASGKRYERESLDDLAAGHAELWYNLDDLLEVGVGVKRTEEIANLHALRQGTEADHRWVGLNGNLGRRWRLEAMAEQLEYTDGNRGEQQTLALGYQLTEHPRQLRVIVDAGHRDTEEMNIYRTVAGQTRDILHPYWTPEDYWSYGVTLDWRHDLARRFFCGGEQHYYDLRLGVGSDSEENPSARLELSWHYEFADHWQAELKGLVHRSEEWDATGLWATLRYSF